jgi:hypothetical protein
VHPSHSGASKMHLPGTKLASRTGKNKRLAAVHRGASC